MGTQRAGGSGWDQRAQVQSLSPGTTWVSQGLSLLSFEVN